MILIPWAASAEQVRQREHDCAPSPSDGAVRTRGGGSGRVTIIVLAST